MVALVDGQAAATDDVNSQPEEAIGGEGNTGVLRLHDHRTQEAWKLAAWHAHTTTLARP
jgi:hypothetical protein